MGGDGGRRTPPPGARVHRPDQTASTGPCNNLVLLVVGMFLESVSAIIILVPMLMSIAVSYGIDPIHFGVVVVLNLSVGLITPPYGICLYVAATVSDRPVAALARRVWIPLLPMTVVLILVTYVPELVLWLPASVMGR